MKYDFGGYVTKNDIKCADGRTIRHDAFKDDNGRTVPLVWQHMHNDPTNVLGHVLLENRDDGVYGYGILNSTPQGKNARELIAHNDITSMSIYANHLKQNGGDVVHGKIREVSLVLAGANPGATIDTVSFEHADGSFTDSDEDVIIHSGFNFDDNELSHAEDERPTPIESKSDDSDSDETVQQIFDSMTDEQKTVAYYLIAQATGQGDIARVARHSDDESSDDSGSKGSGKTVKQVFDSMSEKQKNVIYFIIGSILSEDNGGKSDENEESEDEDSDNVQHDDLGDITMHKNIFEGTDTDTGTKELTHDDMNEILKEAEQTRSSSLKQEFLSHGINQLDVLFPESKSISNEPNLISRPMDWVSQVWNGFRKTPFSRIKTINANITGEEARARGYVKGNKKEEEVLNLLQRATTPQTIYKLQKLDRDDIIDVTDIDVVSWLKREMRVMLDEELARAAIIGDGRSASSPDKIKTDNIRPIYGDDDLYTIYYEIKYAADATEGDKSATLVDSAVKSRKEYRGSGNPVLLASTDVITQMLLARDKIGRRLYANETDLAAALRVSRIIEVPLMEGTTRTYTPSGTSTSKTMELLGLIVNLNDYTIGADRGGAVSLFDDFDIDYNKYTYLIETRCSGALYKPKSAIALEIAKA